VGGLLRVSRTPVLEAARGYARQTFGTAPPAEPSERTRQEMIVLGVILILVGYLLPVPAIIATIGWILLVIGVVLLILGQVGRPVGGRRYWY
jgi:protein-S-isoprenylcysteine O-methyltransferase Ste14